MAPKIDLQERPDGTPIVNSSRHRTPQFACRGEPSIPWTLRSRDGPARQGQRIVQQLTIAPRLERLHVRPRHYLGAFTPHFTLERRAKTRLCERRSSVRPGCKEKGTCSGSDSRILYSSLSPPEPRHAKTNMTCLLKSTFLAITSSASLPKCLAASSCDLMTIGLSHAESLKTLFSGVTFNSTIAATVGSWPTANPADRHNANNPNIRRVMVGLLHSGRRFSRGRTRITCSSRQSCGPKVRGAGASTSPLELWGYPESIRNDSGSILHTRGRGLLEQAGHGNLPGNGQPDTRRVA